MQIPNRWRRERRNGRGNLIQLPAERIYRNVRLVRATGCWEWQGNKEDGYGRFTVAKRKTLAHRYSYEVFVGPIPEGILVCHQCDNPPCCNPEHLFLGTDLDNSRDSIAKGRFHFGARSGLAKLDDDAVREILASTETMRALAAQYGVVSGTISAIKTRKTWRHVQPDPGIFEQRHKVKAAEVTVQDVADAIGGTIESVEVSNVE